MAQIRRYPFFSHLRGEPNQFILHYRKGRIVAEGAGLAYWFNPLSAAIAQVPAEDIETTFVFSERTRDFQEVNVQCSLIYRCVEPRKLAGRVNFTIAVERGLWTEQPLERLTSLFSQKSQPPVRAYLSRVGLEEALREGAQLLSQAIAAALAADPEIQAMGLTCVNIQIDKISPHPDLEKALQTPTRESIQQKADEAAFQRRALAVEKERAIKENELATEIELARRQEDLIRQQGANKLRSIELEAAAERKKVEAEAERRTIGAASEAEETKVKAEGQASARRLLAEVDNEAERGRIAAWAEVPGRVHFGLALQELAKNLPAIEHLNLTPDLVGESLQRLLRDLTDK